MKGCMCTSFNFARHCMLWKTSLLFLTSINKPHLSRRYAKTFWPIPGLISCVYFMKESTIDVTNNGAHLRIPEKKAGLDVMQSHPQHRTCFAQYQASSAALGWPRDGNCYLMHKMQSCGWTYPWQVEASWMSYSCPLEIVAMIQAVIIVTCCG